ncbi:MAG: lipase family protein [Methylobacter sp.]
MSGMNKEMACSLIRASHLAYDIDYDQPLAGQSAKVSQQIVTVGYDSATFKFKASGVDACHYGETMDGSGILAFRGTLPPLLGLEYPARFFDVLSDWLNDEKIPLVTGQHLAGRVHNGFLKSLDTLWPAIKEFIPIPRSKPVYVTGHSKGGGMAYLAAYRLLEELNIQPIIYSFAAPRAGDAQFAAAFNQRIAEAWRFEYRDDLVPHLPLHTGAWFHILQGLHAVDTKFPAEAPHFKLASDAASSFETLLGLVQKNAASFDLNYMSAGTLQFIGWDNPLSIQPDSRGLSWERELSLAKKLAEFKLAEIIQDHASDGGYMICPCGQ